MIAGPLVEPITAPTRLARGGVIVRTVATVLLVVAAAGAWGWLTELSPFAFARWEVFETSATVALDPGTYVVYEEFDGAAGATSRQPLTVFVRSIAGRDLAVVAIDGGEPVGGAPADGSFVPVEPYHTPWHEGRPTGEFTIDRAGTYTVTAFPSESSATGRDYNSLLTSFVALAPVERPGWIGSLGGLLLLTAVPLALGVIAWIVAVVRWPRRRHRHSGRRGRRQPRPV